MSQTPTGQGPFRYALQPLLDWRGWQLDALKAERAAAAKVLDERRRAVDEIGAARRASLQAMAGMRTGGATLDAEADARIRRYIERLDGELLQRRHALEDAARLHDAVVAELRKAWQAAHGMARHRDRLAQLHRDAAGIAASKEADDAWLMSRPQREAASW